MCPTSMVESLWIACAELELWRSVTTTLLRSKPSGNTLTKDIRFHSLDLTSPVKHRFVEELLSTLPAPFASKARIQFCSPSGADAVEAAIKLVKTATGRSGMIAFQGGYHGQTHGALALMGNLGPKVPGLMPDVQFHPYPYAYRCPMGNQKCKDCNCGQFSRGALSDPEGGVALPAGMIFEVVQGEGGVIPAPQTVAAGNAQHLS